MKKIILAIVVIIGSFIFIINSEDISKSDSTNVDSITSATASTTSAAANIGQLFPKDYFSTEGLKYEWKKDFEKKILEIKKIIIIPSRISMVSDFWRKRCFHILKSELESYNIEVVPYDQTFVAMNITGIKYNRQIFHQNDMKKLAQLMKADAIIYPLYDIKTSTGGGFLFPKNNFLASIELDFYSLKEHEFFYWANQTRRRRYVSFSVLNAAAPYTGTVIDLVNGSKNINKLWDRAFKDIIHNVIYPIFNEVE